jgi:CRP/FNR family cyclic AMP-dependent transcriptional regulator
MHGSVASLLDLDDELADAVAGDGEAHARQTLDVRVLHLPGGPWDPTAVDLGARPMGMLVTEGAILRRVRLRHRASAELLGAGDLLRPWLGTPPPFAADWRVIEPASLALLDRRAAVRLALHPEILLVLLEREAARSRRMGERAVTAQLGSTEERLEVELERLGERWGRVGPHGILLRLPLTHEVLGHLIGVRRPAVTSALARMVRGGRLVPLSGGGWLLPAPGGAGTPEPGQEPEPSAPAPEREPLS